MKFLHKAILYLFTWRSTCHCSPHCIDENGYEVDWYALYKLPHIKDHPDSKIADGTAYLFVTSETLNKGWQLSAYNITNPLSTPGKTYSVIYSQDMSNSADEIFWLLYNDQPPNGSPSFTQGHAKGTVIGDENGGIWIVHSIPHFPPVSSSGYQYPSSGHEYGQSFLCISLNGKSLNDIGYQLMVNAVNTYEYKLNDDFDKKYPNISNAAKKTRTDVLQSKVLFSSLRDVGFISFAKSDKYGKDLYSKWVAQVLDTELYVETWLHKQKLPSYCNTTIEVHNIMKLKAEACSCSFCNSKDHSKFAVSAKSEKPWVCIGDINRGSDQFSRAGGTVCFANGPLQSVYSSIIDSVEPCPK